MFWKTTKSQAVTTMLIIVSITSILYSLSSYYVARAFFDNAVDERLRDGATMAAEIMPEELIERAQREDNISREDYVKYSTIAKFAAMRAGFNYLYITINTRDGIKFVFDSPSDSEFERGAFSSDESMHIYYDRPEMLIAAYNSGEERFENYVDRWGAQRGIFMPRVTKNGVKYVAAADIDIKRREIFLQKEIEHSLAIGAIVLFLGALIGYIAFSIIFEPLTKASESLQDEKIESLSQLIERLNGVKGSPEIVNLMSDLTLILTTIEDNARKKEAAERSARFVENEKDQQKSKWSQAVKKANLNLTPRERELFENMSGSDHTAAQIYEALRILKENSTDDGGGGGGGGGKKK
ncbi:MAG: hypothetical protein LBU73_08370 [Helicobacteraceae bacterium]|jgi:hypothetical protein|nr:hypothetical protein [Helicobacteraceae bacterium]